MKYVLVVLLTMGVISGANASCFSAEGKALRDAQTIRKIASEMGWKVGKSASIAAGNFIKGKKTIYPQDMLNICLKDTGTNSLKFKAQSKATDAGEAEWRPLPAKKQ